MKTFKQFVEGNAGLDLVKGLVKGGIKTGIAGAALYGASTLVPKTVIGKHFTQGISNTLSASPYGRAAMDIGSKAKEKLDKKVEPVIDKISPTLKSVDDYVRKNYPETTPPRRPTKLK